MNSTEREPLAEPFNNHQLADSLHTEFSGLGTLSRERIAAAGIRREPNSPTQKIRIHGVIDKRPAYQTLSRCANGAIHFSTVFEGKGGEHIQYHVRDDHRARVDAHALVALGNSLFMDAWFATRER